MDRYLKVQILLQNNCLMKAIDFSNYDSLGDDIKNHVMLEFLTYGDVLIENSIKLRHTELNKGFDRSTFETEYILHDDGLYTYYKFLIPTLNHFIIDNEIVNSIEDEIYYYEGNLYWHKNDTASNLSELLSNSEKLASVLELYNIVYNNHATQTFYLPTKNIFSVCKLNKCLVSLQKELLFDTSCNNTKKHHRDFLLSAMYVFDYLRDRNHFIEAQRLLDNMRDCTYCKDEYINNCNCGTA